MEDSTNFIIEIRKDLERDVVHLVDEIRKLRKRLTDAETHNGELSAGLMDMFFALTCFEQHGIEMYPEDMQDRLRECRDKARKAYIGEAFDGPV